MTASTSERERGGIRGSSGAHPVRSRIVHSVTLTSPIPTSGEHAASPAELIRETRSGRVRGLLRDDLISWRGIPYAAPPVDDLRLRAPQRETPWEGVWDATRFGSVSYQDRSRQVSKIMLTEPRSEDCLTINVTAPAAPSSELRPVMVFIHGGAYTGGSSREIPGLGDVLVREGDVVFVNLNYRLGALGYLDFTRYSTPERPFESNLGLRDQVAALEWVRDCIAAFGGDPERVTVFGESAGANAVTTLLCTPAAAGLFSRAIAESSPVEAIYTPEVTAQWAEDFIRLLRGVTLDQESEPAELLESASADEIVRAQAIMQRTMPDEVPGTTAFSPVIDGDYLPLRPIEAVERGMAHPVPLIIGTNLKEGALFRGRLDLLAKTKPRIRAVFAKTEREAKRRLFEVYRALPQRGSGAQFGGDYTFWYPSVEFAEGHARHAPVHMYRFDIAPTLVNAMGLGATHGIDLFAVFDLTDTPLARVAGVLGGRAAFKRAGERVRERWLRFAREGALDDAWPTYDAATRATLVIDHVDRIEVDPWRERREAWTAFVPYM